MIIFKEIKAKSIIIKSNLPESDFVVNPYTGCSHGCIYCYARFIKRFAKHDEAWGSFTDIKVNGAKLIPKNKDKYKGKTIVIGSVTDAYQPCEEKYEITRKILEKLVTFEAKFDIITKSNLITRDVNLLKRFKDLTVAFSLAWTEDEIAKKVEPGASSINERIAALKILHKNGIRTVVFVSPIFPILSDWKEIILKTKQYTDEYWFENLNIYPSVRRNIYYFLKNNYSELILKYGEIHQDKKGYWNKVENEIKDFCNKNRVKFKIYFHHKKSKKE